MRKGYKLWETGENGEVWESGLSRETWVLPRFVVTISTEAGQHRSWGTGTEQARVGLHWGWGE